MKNLLIISFIMICFINVNGQKANPYQTKGTKEYEEVTSKLLGQWTISSFSSNGKEKIGDLYDKAIVEIKDFDEKGKGGVATFRFTVKRDIIDNRIAIWNKKETTITIDSYEVISNVDYNINNKGDIIYFENQANSVEIIGGGEQLENFQAKENAFIQSQSSMKNSGGVRNLAGAQLLKSVSGTDFVPTIPGQVNYKDLSDKSVDFKTILKVEIKLTK